ncbi:MAG: Holliday junction resolvase Hjc [Candidatus Woesearchaeota archaeon]
MSKIKGTRAERELIKMFWASGWAAIRSAGSGSMHYPSPDILAGNKLRILAVEVKFTNEDKKYFSEEDKKQLINFSEYFGAEPWIAIKFSTTWVFVNPEDLKKTKEGYVFSIEDTEIKGISFEELIGFSIKE